MTDGKFMRELCSGWPYGPYNLHPTLVLIVLNIPQ